MQFNVLYLKYYLLLQNLNKQHYMQLQFYHNKHYASPKLLQKCTSLPSFTQTANSSNNSIETNDHQEFRKLIIKWILAFNKKVAKDTQYLAILYLQNLLKRNIRLSQQNYEQIAITLLLMASKMNEIYPPKLSLLLSKSKKKISKQEIIVLESRILQSLNYDIALENTIYTLINEILGQENVGKLEQCQKLLRIIVSNREVYNFGEQILAYSIVYLIIPKYVKDLQLRDGQKIKAMAIKIYNLYSETKEQYQKQKQNRAY